MALRPFHIDIWTSQEKASVGFYCMGLWGPSDVKGPKRHRKTDQINFTFVVFKMREK